MPTHTLPLSRLLLIAFLFVATGCPQTEHPSAAPSANNASAYAAAAEVQDKPDPLPTDFITHMGFSVVLLDSSTGLPTHTHLDVLKPTLLREVERVTYEPTLRQVLNKPAVQNTKWFKQFEGNYDEAYESLKKSIAAHHVPGTPIFRVFILRSLATEDMQDAQTLLRTISDEYMRLKRLEINASVDEHLRNAQRTMEAADEVVADRAVRIKRFLQNNPISSSGSVERSRMNAIELESLQRQLKQAEARRDRANTKVLELNQQTKGFLGYYVTQEYAPQKAR